jgi:hypothetical protein
VFHVSQEATFTPRRRKKTDSETVCPPGQRPLLGKMGSKESAELLFELPTATPQMADPEGWTEAVLQGSTPVKSEAGRNRFIETTVQLVEAPIDCRFVLKDVGQEAKVPKTPGRTMGRQAGCFGKSLLGFGKVATIRESFTEGKLEMWVVRTQLYGLSLEIDCGYWLFSLTV